jgi:hypothetical protein
LSDDVRGLDAVTYNRNGAATRWARAGVQELRLYAPLDTSAPREARIRVDVRTRPEVIRTIRLFSNGKKVAMKSSVGDDALSLTAPIVGSLTDRGVVLVIRFSESRDGTHRHTLGLHDIEIA